MRSNHLSYEPEEVFDEYLARAYATVDCALTRRYPRNRTGIRRKRKGNEGGVKAAIV